MKQYFGNLVNRLSLLALAIIVAGAFCPEASAQGLNVSIGSANVDITPGSGTANATIDIAIENPTGGALPLASYSFFLEIEPVDGSLPAGVTFATPAATYSSGDGAGFLIGANQDGTVNLTPAAGDLGLGQFQFFDASLAAGASEDLVTINLVIDLGTAVAGDYTVSLATAGQNSISSVNDFDQAFTSTDGTLTLGGPFTVVGDVNCDGNVDFLDLSPFIALLSSGGFSDKADIDRSGVVDFLDIAPFISLLSGA